MMLAGRQLHQREDGRWVARVPGLAEEVFPACIGRVKCVWSVKFGHGFLIFPELSRWLTSPEECMSTIARRGRPRPGAKKIESLEDNPEPAPTRTNGNHKAHGGIEVFSGPKRAKTEDPGVAPGPGEAWHAVVPIDLVDANPWQPRRDFGEAELEELKAMIAVQGLLNPPVARKVGARYQLAAGERRWRACQSLGWLTITLSVRTLTDAEMRRVAFQENKGRKDLSPIERARELRSMLDAGDASGVCDLAQKLGMTEPPVSELLRLLELPETFQRRLISQEITQTQARCLLPYRALAGIMDAIDKDLGKEPFTGNTEAFAELVQDAIWEATERMKGEKWTGIDALHFHGNVPIFEPTPEQREQLGVIEVDCRWRAKQQRGKPELRATNKKLWKKLQEAHAKKWIAEQAGKGGAKRPDRPPTEKEKQALAKQEAGRRAEQLRLTRRKIWGWRIDRLRQAAAEALVSAEADRQERIAVYLIVASEAWELDGSAVRRHADDRENALNAALRSCGAKQAGKHPWGAILDCKQVGALWIKTCAEILWGSDHGPECKIPDEAVVSIAEHLEVELAQLWRADQKSGLGRAFFALHTREQLLDLGKELGVPLFEKQDKAAMVRVLSTAAKNLKLPKELAKAKKP